MSHKVTISNGEQFFRIDAADLDEAVEDGFYRLFDRGQTIVGDGKRFFEIPLARVDTAMRDGLRDYLKKERASWNRERQGLPAERPQESSNGVPTEQQANLAASVPAVVIGAIESLEPEAQHKQVAAEPNGPPKWKNQLLLVCAWLKERRGTIVSQLRGNGISAAIHASIFLILASLFIKVEEEPKGIVVSVSPVTETVIEETIIEPTPLEISEPIEISEPEPPAKSEAPRVELVESPNFMAAIQGDAIKPPTKAATDGDGKGESRSMKPASFFGNKVQAVDYVFVIDNSNSMTGGRFETALLELMNAVNQLTARQRFYVIFYSDMAYPMFHPQPATQLIQATPRNKAKLGYWLDTVELCLKTEGKQAIEAAFKLKPDVIFVLGDGAFTDRASQHFAAKPQKRIPLHTLGMEVKPKDAETFKKLAVAHGGTYKDVGVAPQAKAIAKQYPRRRNSKRGPVWGLKLK